MVKHIYVMFSVNLAGQSNNPPSLVVIKNLKPQVCFKSSFFIIKPYNYVI